MQALKINPIENDYFEIRVHSIPIELPLLYDVYLIVNGKATLFRNRGDIVTQDRLKNLIRHGGEKFLVPNEQKDLYLHSLHYIIHEVDSAIQVKSRFLKESAFFHLNELFMNDDIAEPLKRVMGLVGDMVSFISGDVELATTLMRLSIHDHYTYNHSVNVAVYSIALAKQIYKNDRKKILKAGFSGLLHDIGKRKLSSQLLHKKDGLTSTEIEEINRHPQYGKDSLDPYESISLETKLVVYQHHENFDGSGYPQGLKGKEISELARLVSIADVFDALTLDTAAHKSLTAKEALNAMFGMQPGKFDPKLFRNFNKDFKETNAVILDKNFDPCQPQKIVTATEDE